MAPFIIEHPTRGILMGQEFEDFDGEGNSHWKSRFAWSKPRSEAEQYPTREAVANALLKLKPSVRPGCTVLEYGTWREVNI